MKYLDEYRNPTLAKAILAEIHASVTRPWVLMEICGGQTHSLMRYGIDELLPPQIELVHGPGCPVCVTPLEMVDKAIQIAARPDVIFLTYGDMMRVPGSEGDLLQAKAAGGDVRFVYSPMQALEVARQHPDKQVVFFAVGFETTAPANAQAVWQAAREGLGNYSALVSHVLVPPALTVLLSAPENRVQGLIAPGHVCSVAGCADYASLAARFQIPIVVGGFEPLDLLQSILMLVQQLESGQTRLENQYSRVVSAAGNPAARRMVEEVYEVCDRRWRGIGELPLSGLRLRRKYAGFDAEVVFGLEAPGVEEDSECISAQVLMGQKKPTDCPAFGIRCSPERPLGAPMVSSEGACSAYYQYKLVAP
ncbi:MAG: hydrogenase formation protein HypD [Bryobacteraceae bacterium]|nr:hydrogenase formation protein HypD [Bryobacteraceae bacterium]